uniref:Putative secreted peptide n=1 Tax=Anopheles braziliensis TaxID=58242 RepID=A0A2M3ZSW9_9DIPT
MFYFVGFWLIRCDLIKGVLHVPLREVEESTPITNLGLNVSFKFMLRATSRHGRVYRAGRKDELEWIRLNVIDYR